MSARHELTLPGGSALTVTIGTGQRRLSDDRGRRWEHHRYPVTLTHDGRTMRCHYSQGRDWPVDAVEPADVLASLVVDFRAAENAPTFADYCATFGADPDSRTAERDWRELRGMRQRIGRVLGLELEAFLTAYAEGDDE